MPTILTIHMSEPGLTAEDSQDTVQSGRSRGEYRASLVAHTWFLRIPVMERDWKDRAVGTAGIALDVAKGAAEAFGPLKAVLEAVSALYSQYKVCLPPSIGNSLLKFSSSGNCRRQGQDSSAPFACRRVG